MFDDWTPVDLYAPGRQAPPKGELQVPMTAWPGEVPRLIAVQWPGSGRIEIAQGTSWGTPTQGEEVTAIRVNPDFLSKLAAGKLQKTRKHPAKVRRARWTDLARYKRGLVARVWLALLVAAAAITGAVVLFFDDAVPVALAAAVVALVALAEVGKALLDIGEALTRGA